MRVNLLFGARGAGKTTLLAAILARGLPFERLAVIMNEPGEARFGAEALLLEIPACVCCEGRERLLSALCELARGRHADRVLVEASEDADGPSLLAFLHQAPELRGLVAVDLSLCVVDASTALPPARLLRAADLVVASKVDVAPVGSVSRLESAVRDLRPRGLFVAAVRGELDLGPALSCAAASTPGSPFGSAHIREPGLCVDPGRLTAFLEALPPCVIRAEGVAAVSGGAVAVRRFGGNLDLAPANGEGVDLCFSGADLDPDLLREALVGCRDG
jgi:G3E family GTPase